MKNKTEKKNDYSKFKKKLFFQVAFLTVTSAALVLILRELLRGKFGDMVVNYLQKSFYLEENDASTIYQFTFRNNLHIFLAIAFIIIFLIGFYFIISWFTKYFDEISNGMDILVQKSNDEISLPSELTFMESKLNNCKNIIKNRERDAQLAEQRKNDLVIYLAHDIKTPLTSVIGYLSLLDEAPDMPQEQKAKYVGITLEKALRLETLINEFFEITRYNLQKITLEKENIDLYYMLVQMIDEFFPLLNPQGKKALLKADEDILLCGDPNKLARVFNNVLKNAIAYSDPNSTIYITAQSFDNKIVIRFENTGRTIPKEKLLSIFDKFYRIDEARGTESGGSGLGLAIAKEIVTLHRGKIYAESENNHTVFTVELPII